LRFSTTDAEPVQMVVWALTNRGIAVQLNVSFALRPGGAPAAGPPAAGGEGTGSAGGTVPRPTQCCRTGATSAAVGPDSLAPVLTELPANIGAGADSVVVTGAGPGAQDVPFVLEYVQPSAAGRFVSNPANLRVITLSAEAPGDDGPGTSEEEPTEEP